VSRSRSLTLHSHWAFLSLIPLGFGAWAPIYAGVKARRSLWVVLGIVWSAIVIAGFIANSVSSSGQHGNDDFAGFLILIGWIGAVATSFTLRSAYDRQMASPLLEATDAAEQRLHDRDQARRIARDHPALAREMGIGRPDRHGAADAGLVDVNNASVTALLKLPGIDGDLATEICECREKVGGFSSLEDFGATLDIDGGVVDGLRDKVVFLPRS
jgi:hypothetical protein